jgi:transmembrane sensor
MGSVGLTGWDTEHAWQALRAAMAPSETAVRQAAVATSLAMARSPRLAAGRTAWLRAAAIILLVAGAALVSARLLFVTSQPGAAIAGRVESTGRGERRTMKLPDGSEVTLAPASSLTFNEVTFARARAVQLDGEAYFRVSHDAARPFTVHSGNVSTRVLGTEFSVRSRGERNGVRIVVAAGRVAVSFVKGAAGSETLERGDLAELAGDGRVRVERGVDVSTYTGWTSGRLAFRDVTLGEAIPELERWYAVQLRAGDSAISARRFTATFGGEPVGQVLVGLALALDADLVRDDSVATLRARAAAR